MRVIERLKNDRLLFLSLFIDCVLIACHAWQYIDSGYLIECLIRGVATALYLPLALIFGRKCWPVFFPALAYSILYFNRFYNYTSFFIICLCCYYLRKYKILYLVLYAGFAIAALLINDCTASHVLIHLINCFWIYLIVDFVINNYKNNVETTQKQPVNLGCLDSCLIDKKQPAEDEKTTPPTIRVNNLTLTLDEIKILDELAAGADFKAVKCFSVNIVFKKLREARERNNIKTNKELLTIYYQNNNEVLKS